MAGAVIKLLLQGDAVMQFRLIALIVTVLLNSSCVRGNGEPDSNSPNILVHDFKSQAQVAMLPVKCDSLDNEYQEKYREWDLWIFEHLSDMPDFKTISHDHDSGTAEETNSEVRHVSVRFTEEGCLVPQLEYTIQLEEARKFANDEIEHPRYLLGMVSEEMPQELWQAMHAEIDAIVAKYYPPVPDWLAANPPLGASLYPNGDVVTRGPLGSGSPDDKLMAYHHAEEVFRFDHSGSQLHTVEGNNFWFLYHDPWVNGFPKGKYSNRIDGFVYFTDENSGEILSIYDYDGTQLGTTSEPPDRDQHNFFVLGYKQIKKLHAAQQASGTGLNSGGQNEQE